MRRLALLLLFLLAAPALLLATPLAAQQRGQTDAMANDRVGTYFWVRPQADFVRRQIMLEMRDGRLLYTVIVHRKGISDAPILFSRTPYDAAATTARIRSQKIEDIVPLADIDFVNDGYIVVYQDVRGMERSEGDYVMARPLRGPLNKAKVDHATDAWDTIDWMVKNLTETNGKVAMIGSSYLGLTALMALAEPHPAMKLVVPQHPMVDGWMGDDWFHNGAFRMSTFDYILRQTVARGGGPVPLGDVDDYTAYLAEGSAGDFARAWGFDQFPAVRKLFEHPAYDSYWQLQALDRVLGARKLTVPVLLVAGQWDQEDSYGAPAMRQALAAVEGNADKVHFALGPWRHSGVNYPAKNIGPLTFPEDTAERFRRQWMKPFVDCHLKSNPPPCAMPRVLSYATGADRWESGETWPEGVDRPLFLSGGSALSFTRPSVAGADTWEADPADPVPMMAVPARLEGEAWRNWLVMDQRFLAPRKDVIGYVTPPLDKAVQIKGAPRVELFAATTGRDSDWVVKLIDVYPATGDHAGYQLPIGIEIFRGRYVHGFDKPAPLEPGRTYRYEWRLPHVNHVFRPGHRIMVQVQSSLFPLYDRNPQGWPENIFQAKPQDYVKATQSVHHGGEAASAVWLPLVER